jgi:CBS domain-containing protein
VDRQYDPLPIRELDAGAGLRRPTHGEAARVTPDSPALQVGANQFMITRGVRLLLVVDEHDAILGVITATDLLGERPMQVATGRGLRRDELNVADVMTPGAQVEVLALADVERSRVGHVLETLRRLGRQHALVVDAENMVRGIFSISQIARQLGVALPPGGEVARTFSEIEAALAR